jgi:catechol 2,3-dioxygenase-like lactoylglutathione lyase family enzyme
MKSKHQLRLLGVELYFEDVPRARDFYTSILGLPLEEYQPSHHAKLAPPGGFLCLEVKACTRAGDRAERKRFKLARDVRGFEVELGRKLDTPDLVLYEWHRFSQPFLNPAETRDDHLAAFLAELAKVREPTSEDDKLQKALENVLKLLPDQLPTLPSAPEKFREKYRRLAALHREMSRLCEGKIYFLSYRDAAKVCDGLSHQEAHMITYGLVTLGVIEIVRKGKAGLNSRKASEFRYLLSQTENVVAN